MAFGSIRFACLRLCPFLMLNISETARDRGLFTIGGIYESGQAKSNGDVTVDVR